MDKKRTLCVQWPRFGPYHIARLTAAHEEGLRRGDRLIAIETARSDVTYEWEIETESTPFQREVVLEKGAYEQLGASKIYKGITSHLDRIQPDAVATSSYSTPDARACLLWCRRNRRTAVLMTETKEDDALRISWRERVKSLLIRLYDAALVGGTPHQAYLEKLGFPSDYIFQGCDVVDNDFFDAKAKEFRQSSPRGLTLPGLDDRSPYFLASNRFIPRKNLDRLLLAYKAYRHQVNTPWRLLLLGDGPERAALEALVRNQAIDGVVFCGFQQIQDLPAYYASAGAFVHPAVNDQWGLVVNEAMASGLPVIVSRNAGCAQDLVYQGQNGFVFDPEDTAELTKWLCVLSDPQTNRSQMSEASKRMIAQWSPRRFGENLWRALDAGMARAYRGRHFERALLWSIQRLARNVTSFHSLKD